MVTLAAIAIFWTVAAGACLRPTPWMRGIFLVAFFSLLLVCGLSYRLVWPFFSWDMWSRVRAAYGDWTEIALVDSTGREWLYDFSVLAPATPTIIETACGVILLGQGEKAPGLAEWLLHRARALRDSSRIVDPRWWSNDLGFLPVGPAARESCEGWASDPAARPADFVELLVRKRRVHFSTRSAPVRQEIIEEKRFPWTGS